MKLCMQKNYSHFNEGFTLIELLIVLGIMGILFTFGAMSLLNIQSRTYLDSNIITLLSDIRRQQIKSMLGETNGGASTYSFGIKFDTGSYTLFRGTVYSPSDPGNLTINLEGNTQFSNVTLPSGVIVFDKGSGEVNGFTAGSNTFVVRDTGSNQQKTITINRYGVITTVN